MKRFKNLLSLVLIVTMIFTQALPTFQYISFAGEKTNPVEIQAKPTELKTR